MLSLFHVLVARLGALFRRGDRGEFDQEIETHLAMAEDEYVSQGSTREEARRKARAELGGLTQLREAAEATRSLPWLGTFWLDARLGLRMCRRSWGLTLVGGLAIAVTIAIAALPFTVAYPHLRGTLPLDEGDRVVGLMNWNPLAQRRQRPSLQDFVRWRDTLRSVEDVGAFRTVERSVVTPDSPAAEPVSVAEMTASGFRLARVAPLLGRALTEIDERDGAPPVVVIGHDVWLSRFGADPAVVGQTIQLGGTAHAVVGVMPEGFAFPFNDRFWTPLRTDPAAEPQEGGPVVFAFARLGPGVALETAEAELKGIGLPPASAGPETTSRLQPVVVPYSFAISMTGAPFERLLVSVGLLALALALLPPAANIAILVYARMIARQDEFAARYALGASPGRIVGQIFIETLVLAVGAAVMALLVVKLILRRGIFDGGTGDPFWIDYSDLSVPTVLFAAGLAVLAAAIAGALPAFQATRRMRQSGLHALGSANRLQLGTTWTALVVAQVAIAVGALPTAVEMAWGSIRPAILGPGFAAENFLTARIAVDQNIGQQVELIRQLEAEPGVSAVTVSAAAPGLEPLAYVEVEDAGDVPISGAASAGGTRLIVGSNRVDDAFFDVFDVRLQAGRTFDWGDAVSGPAVVVVNRTLAQELAQDGSPLGRRIRYVASTSDDPAPAAAPWHEIVGIVDDVPANSGRPLLYHPLSPGGVHPASVSLRVGSASASVARRLPELAAAVDPALRVREILPLDEAYRRSAANSLPMAVLVGAAAASLLLLSAAGIYALMSFAVARRRREIGIRSALGAQPRYLLAGVFRRAFHEVATGALVGLLVALIVDAYFGNLAAAASGVHADVPGIVPAVGVLMMATGLLAASGPARRALRVNPTDALRDGF